MLIIFIAIFIIILTLFLINRIENFKPATESIIGPSVQYTLDTSIYITYPNYSLSIPNTDNYHKINLVDNFKFNPKVLNCVISHLKTFIKYEITIDNIEDIKRKDDLFVFDFTLVFLGQLNFKRYRIYIRVINYDSCEVLALKEVIQMKRTINQVYGKLDNTFKITNPLRLLRPFQ